MGLMKLIRRIVAERRSIVLPLTVALIVNVAVTAFVVFPLETRSASAADRAAEASRSLKAADRDLRGAKALVSEKKKADEELATFYKKVLPADLSAARRMTYPFVPALARKTNLRYESQHQDVEDVREPGVKESARAARFERLKTRVVLQGSYEGVRQFVYQLETAPEFVIIDDVSLAQGEADKPLTLTLQLSTYYRLGADGT